VRGLSTAATVRVLAGADYLVFAGLATGFILFVNPLIWPIIAFINAQPLLAGEISELP
jgi:hypothetical protein